MRRIFWAISAGAFAFAVIILGTIFAIGWVDNRGDEFVAKRLQAHVAQSAAPRTSVATETLADAQLRANAYTAAASYLNFNYGVPLSVVIALLGGFVTLAGVLIGWRLTSRQGDVEILKFIEDKITPAIRHQQDLTSVLAQLIRWGNRTRYLSVDLRAAIDGEGGRDHSTLFTALERPRDANIAALAPETARLANEAIAAVGELYGICDQLQDVFKRITDDLYSYFFFRLEDNDVPSAHRPLLLLAEHLPDTAEAYPLLFGASLPDLALSLNYFAKATRPSDLVNAIYTLPSENLTLEFIGNVIFSLSATPYRLVEQNDALTARYNYNFGAAYLITLIQAMPTKKTIISGFKRMFGNRSAVAETFIAAAVPEKSEMGPSTIQASLHESLTTPSRLITADVLTDGPQSVSARGEIYQRTRHGPLFTQVHLAGPNEKGATLASRALFNSSFG